MSKALRYILVFVGTYIVLFFLGYAIYCFVIA